ncbi:MAG: YkgJ family cysteine cluster protein [Phycisphaerae bacterium]|nr:YkgJ family cysteine cluster protein [Phycisphaerae bacterium]
MSEHPSDAAEGPHWYQDGLRFTCTQCGNCCTGGPGAVWFTAEEGQLIAARLGLSEAAFLDRYTRRVGARRSFTEHETDYGFDCVFLARTGAHGRCSIYDLRPTQCRTWPFWPEIVESPEAWARAKAVTPCPGMDQGETHAFVTIRIAVDRDRKSMPYRAGGAGG